MDIEKMDPNLKAISGNCEGVEFISAHDKRFSLHGVYFDKEEKIYRRVPESVASQVSDYLVALGKMTAGGRIRFITDSPYIAIKASLPYYSVMSHMTITGSHGFSVYADGVFQNRYSPVPKALAKPLPKGERIYFADKKPLLKEKGKKLVEIYFPLYGGVAELFIGVEPNSIIEKAPDYAIEKPLVFYGSSLTQGACVSRPGNDYVSIISRRVNADYINLGFSGNGNAEDCMIDFINSIDGSVYVFDYNLYANFPDRVLPPHYSIYERIRKAHPNAGIILTDKPCCDYDKNIQREQTILETYERAIAEGDKMVAHVPAYELFGKTERDCCTVDGLHPNDLGAARMADALTPAVKKLLGI